MKLIDRYILANILTPLFYCLAAFLMIFIIFDLFSNLSDFIEAGTELPYVLRYYLFLIPSVVVFIVPISLLLAVLYGLSQLTRNNELTAMRASGVSLYRLMTPLIILGFLASLSVWAVNETVGPWSAHWTAQFIRAEKHKGDVSPERHQVVGYVNPRERRIWEIGEFNSTTYEMSRVRVIEQREDGSEAVRYLAQRARWVDGRWWFSDVTVLRLGPDGQPMRGELPDVRSQMMMDFNELPRDFLLLIKDPEFLSSRELVGYLQSHQHLSRDTLARIEVDLHYRLAMPWTCFIVTLLGLPIGAQTGRKGALLGVAMILGLFFGFYVLINFGLALGKNQTIPPWVAGWMPNLIFLVIGIAAVKRMR